MKESIGFRCIISLFLILSILITPVMAETEPTDAAYDVSQEQATYGCFSTDATDALLGFGEIVKNVKSAFLYERNTKTLMYAWEPDLALPPSSFVKILTAIIAIEKGKLDSAVTVTEDALSDLPASAVSVDLVVNEVMPLKELIYCMLVGSANDAAAVIAQYLSGSQYAFANEMNAFAQQIGCTGSNFTNAHGLHDPMQITTARDTAKILDYAMQNEVFREIFSSAEYTVPATNKSAERYLITGNYLMSMEEVEIYFDERVKGGRTGVASDSSRCLASIAKVGSMELLCVVMGAESVYEQGGNKIRSFGGYNETKALLDAGFTGYAARQILFDGQPLIQFDIPNADALLSVGSHSTVSTVLPENITVADLIFRYSEDGRQLRAPISKGDKVCGVEVWYQGLLLASTDLYAMNDVRDNVSIQTDEPAESNLWSLAILLVSILLLIGAVVFMVGTRRGKRIRRRIRKLLIKLRKGK